ncbi:MAG: nucleotide exchange factor GrpE [Pseudomonadota bacterium]
MTPDSKPDKPVLQKNASPEKEPVDQPASENAQTDEQDNAFAGPDAPANSQTDNTTDSPIDSEAGLRSDNQTDGLQVELEALREENQGLNDKLLRALAELENTRRRAAREREDALKFSIASFARDLLEVIDNLQRAADSDTEDLSALLEGVQSTSQQLTQTLGKHGIKPVPTKGHKFDPNLHEAMFEVPTDELDDGVIAEVVLMGYTLHDRLLRPASVGVAKKPAPPQKTTVDTQV